MRCGEPLFHIIELSFHFSSIFSRLLLPLFSDAAASAMLAPFSVALTPGCFFSADAFRLIFSPCYAAFSFFLSFRHYAAEAIIDDFLLLR